MSASGSVAFVSPGVFLVVGVVGFLLAWMLVPFDPEPDPARPGGERSTGGGQGTGAVQSHLGAAVCAPYNAQIWAQSVFDQAPLARRALDPDGNGLACEMLPLGAAPALWVERVPLEAEPVVLLDAIDGDTIEIRRGDGTVERVRLVGIDTPETGLGSQPLECYGPEASRFTADLLPGVGGTVYLEKDVEERDRYDRLLRWVWFEASGRPYLANEAIVRSGYAERYRDTPNRLHLDRVVAAETFARGHGYGLWGACG